MELELNINGVITSLDVSTQETLLTLLRREGYTGVKQGCETGDCGACTVLVDGLPRPGCVMLAAQAGGCTVTTIEGLATGAQMHPLQQAFAEIGAAQCGFCTPGMILSASALLKKNPQPSAEEAREAISGNLCRCSNYERPVRAILRAATLLRKEAPVEEHYEVIPVREEGSSARQNAGFADGATTKIPLLSLTNATASKETKSAVIGQAIPPIDGAKLVTGKPVFAADKAPRNLLHARVLTSPHAHALIRDIDIAEAKALPGVQAVLTHKDLARLPFSAVERAHGQEVPQDQFGLDYIVRFVGDHVAVVAAETAEIAEQALSLIRVDYEVFPPILDPRQALEEDAPLVHPESDAHGIYDASRNIAARVGFDSGDIERAFAAADLVVEGEYFLPMTQQITLEKQTVISYFSDEDILIVRSNTQQPHHVRRTLARLLNLPVRRIRVEQTAAVANSGFSQELRLENLASLLTGVTHQPVSLSYTREDQGHCVPVQQQHIVRMKTGVTREGSLVAQQIVMLSSTGAYATHPLIGNAALLQEMLSLYPCVNTRFVSDILYTNLPPSAALQGQGLPPACFALECHMDEVAKQVGLDALALRRRNWINVGDEYPGRKDAARGRMAQPMVESSALPDCLSFVEEQIHWREKRGIVSNGRERRGVGAALALQGLASWEANTSGAMMKLNEDGTFDVFVAASEQTFGTSTLLSQVAAEVLGVSLEDIFVYSRNAEAIPFAAGASGSSAFYGSGGAVRKAAEQVRRQILAIAGRLLNVVPETLKINAGVISAPSAQAMTIRQIAEQALAVEGRQIMTTASWKVQQAPVAFAALGAEVEVDTETGVVRVIKLVCAADAGKVINPLILESQLQGTLAQAVNAVLCEDLLYDAKGVIHNADLRAYHLHNALAMPEMQIALFATNDPFGPFGAKAIAELPLQAVSAAIANAVANALGTRIRQLPLIPERILRAIHGQSSQR